VQDLARQLAGRDRASSARSKRRAAGTSHANAELDAMRTSAQEDRARRHRPADRRQQADPGQATRSARPWWRCRRSSSSSRARGTLQTSTRSGELSREDLAAGTVSWRPGPQKDLDHARDVAGAPGDVPCGGAGEFAACQFLVNATAAEARIAALEQQLAGLQAAIAARDGLDQQLQALDGEIKQTATTISRLEGALTAARKTAEYEKALIDSDARLAELRTKQADVETAAGQDAEAARTRHHQRTLQFDAADLQLAQTISRLETDAAGREERRRPRLGRQGLAVHDAADRAGGRARGLGHVTAILASVASRRQELERRREVVKGKQAQLRSPAAWPRRPGARRVARPGEGARQGRPAGSRDRRRGPEHQRAHEHLLTACFGPRFSLELVTQVAEGGRLRA
jgi:hypothetical protein